MADYVLSSGILSVAKRNTNICLALIGVAEDDAMEVFENDYLLVRKINGSIPIVAEAIAKRDSEFIKARAKLQAESGATYIDCCASVPEAEEVETLKWMIDCIQEVTDLPISIDSPSPDVLAQAYKFCKKPGIFNSVSGEGHKIDTIFPIMAEPGNDAVPRPHD